MQRKARDISLCIYILLGCTISSAAVYCLQLLCVLYPQLLCTVSSAAVYSLQLHCMYCLSSCCELCSWPAVYFLSSCWKLSLKMLCSVSTPHVYCLSSCWAAVFCLPLIDRYSVSSAAVYCFLSWGVPTTGISTWYVRSLQCSLLYLRLLCTVYQAAVYCIYLQLQCTFLSVFVYCVSSCCVLSLQLQDTVPSVALLHCISDCCLLSLQLLFSVSPAAAYCLSSCCLLSLQLLFTVPIRVTLSHFRPQVWFPGKFLYRGTLSPPTPCPHFVLSILELYVTLHRQLDTPEIQIQREPFFTLERTPGEGRLWTCGIYSANIHTYCLHVSQKYTYTPLYVYQG